MKKKIVPSEQTQQDAMAVAKAIQKPGQTKEQTKLIAQGIEKGIALYKKQQKEKNRQADKAKKRALKTKQANAVEVDSEPHDEANQKPATNALPWILLVLSWIGVFTYWYIQNQ